MLRHQRLLESANHIGESVGDLSPLIRADFEDALVMALEDTLRDGKLSAFRSFIQGRWGREFPDSLKDCILNQDPWAWYTVYFYSCALRRMGPRWEYCANKLKDEYMMDPQQIPTGMEWLHI